MTTDLEPRFRRADRLPAPDLWAAIERRADGSPHGPVREGRRWLTIAVAAVVAAGAFGGLWRAFNGSGHPATGLHANGPIAFAKTIGTGADGLAITQLWARDPVTGRTRQMMTGPGAIDGPVFSPDGSMVVYRALTVAKLPQPNVRTVPGFAVHTHLVIAATNGSSATTLKTCSAGRCEPQGLVWSPDGTHIAWVATIGGGISVIRVADAADGAVTTVCAASCGPYLAELAWSPDGSRLAFSNDGMPWGDGGPRAYPSAIWVAAADGSSVHRLTTGGACGPQVACTADRRPSWSPDGKSIVFYRSPTHGPNGWNFAPFPSSLMHMDESGAHLHSIGSCNACGITPLWSPDGHLLAVDSAAANGIDLLDAGSGVLRGTLSTKSNSGCTVGYPIAWSPDGTELLVAANPWQVTNLCIAPIGGALGRDVPSAVRLIAHDVVLFALSPPSGSVVWLPAGPLDPAAGPKPSPAPASGELVSSLPLPSGQVLFDVNHVRGGQPHGGAYLVHSDGGGSVRHPACADTFSPDGSSTACAIHTPGGMNEIVVSRDGQQVAVDKAPSGHYAYTEAPTWSPVGSLIAYSAFHVVSGRGTTDIRLFDRKTHRDWFLRTDETDPAWSPDGTRIAATPPNRGSSDGQSEIDAISVTSGGKTPVLRVPGVVSNLAWSPDGLWIAFRWDTVTGSGIWVVHPDGTGLRLVPTATDALVGQMAWSPDSRYLVFGAGDAHLRRGLYAARISDGATTLLARAQPGVSDVIWIPGSS